MTNIIDHKTILLLECHTGNTFEHIRTHRNIMFINLVNWFKCCLINWFKCFINFSNIYSVVYQNLLSKQFKVSNHKINLLAKITNNFIGNHTKIGKLINQKRIFIVEHWIKRLNIGLKLKHWVKVLNIELKFEHWIGFTMTGSLFTEIQQHYYQVFHEFYVINLISINN